jgi:uncharacterized membrane protein
LWQCTNERKGLNTQPTKKTKQIMAFMDHMPLILAILTSLSLILLFFGILFNKQTMAFVCLSLTIFYAVAYHLIAVNKRGKPSA